MTFDPTAQSVGVGGMVFLSALWILLKYKPWKNGNGERSGAATSAGLTANEWKSEIRKAAKEALEETAPKRHADLERLMERVLEREFVSRNDTLRKMMMEVIGEWLDIRLGEKTRDKQH